MEQIRQIKDGYGVSYILESPGLFFSTGYKVMQAQQDQGFVPCFRVIHNGKDKLVYNTSNYKSLNLLLPGLQPEVFINTIRQVFQNIGNISKNGFMQCQNIDVTLDNIFIDTTDFSPHLIYLPVESDNTSNGELKLKQELLQQIESALNTFSHLKTPAVINLVEKQGPQYSIEDITRYIQGSQEMENATTKLDVENVSEVDAQEPQVQNTEKTADSIPKEITPAEKNKKKKFSFARKSKTEAQVKESRAVVAPEITGGATEVLDEVFEPSIMLQGINNTEEIEILVTKDNFLIGKKADQVDGLISFNNAVSRVHCRILCRNGNYYLADAGSANGTYLNGGRLEPEHETVIRPGDKVKLANMMFIIKKV